MATELTQKYILALDQGTTSSRAIIVDHAGNIVASAQKPFEQIFPRPGWVEHDPGEIWYTQSSVAAEAVAKADLTGLDIACIGITNQRETTIVWDRETSLPIYNAIVWQDRRTADYCELLKREGRAETIRAKTGLILDAYFSATKIKWILDHVEGARERAEKGKLCFGTVDSWIVWKFTRGRVHVTDVSNASRTMLFNIHTLAWDRELLELFDIPESMLPTVCDSSEIYCDTATTLFSTKIPISGIAGDQQAALFGQLCTEPGMVKTTYGTGCFMMANTGDQAVASKNRLLTTIAWRIGGRVTYALEGSAFVGGAVIQWLRDELRFFAESPDAEYYAQKVSDNGGVYLVPAFTGLGAPYWDMYARGAILGITRGTKREHIIRAAQESIAYQVCDLVHAMESDTGVPLRELKADGGASRDGFLLQFQADIMDRPVCRPAIRETTALGCAYLAGLAVGVWKDREEIRGLWKQDALFRPGMEQEKREKLLSDWHKAVGRSRDWAR